ncbi:MAG: PEP-CTERM sorting domain-containing protein [Verrucomicrobiota bacterium]
MDPSLTVGSRKFFTTLDFAGLQDIGWQLSAIPEPSTLVWAAVAGALGVGWRRRSRRA